MAVMAPRDHFLTSMRSFVDPGPGFGDLLANPPHEGGDFMSMSYSRSSRLGPDNKPVTSESSRINIVDREGRHQSAYHVRDSEEKVHMGLLRGTKQRAVSMEKTEDHDQDPIMHINYRGMYENELPEFDTEWQDSTQKSVFWKTAEESSRRSLPASAMMNNENSYLAIGAPHLPQERYSLEKHAQEEQPNNKNKQPVAWEIPMAGANSSHQSQARNSQRDVQRGHRHSHHRHIPRVMCSGHNCCDTASHCCC